MYKVALSRFPPVTDLTSGRARRQAVRPGGDHPVVQPTPTNSEPATKALVRDSAAPGALAFAVMAELLIIGSTRAWRNLP